MTIEGARIRDYILAYPAATQPEIAELAAREGLVVTRGRFKAIRAALQYEGYNVPPLPRGHVSKRAARKPLEPKEVPEAYPRPAILRCLACGQVLR